MAQNTEHSMFFLSWIFIPRTIYRLTTILLDKAVKVQLFHLHKNIQYVHTL